MNHKKNILLIAPSFFGYADLIKDAFIQDGYQVQLYYDTYVTNTYNHIFKNYKVMRTLDKFLQKRHLNKIQNSYSPFDIFFMIKGQYLSVEFITQLKSRNPNSTFVMYQWDSKQVFEYEHYMNLFNIKLSFDILDCAQDSRLKIMPTFYTFEPRNPIKEESDLFFIGTYKPFRKKMLENIAKEAEQNGITYVFYLLSFKYFLGSLITRNTNIRYIPFPYSKKKVQNLMEKSKAVLDLCNPKQTGITQRAFDTLILQRKLVTNNSFIKEEAFFDENNIFLFHNDIKELTKKFFEKPFVKKEMENYSLSGFVKRFTQYIED